jgi:hypothetical protein
MRRILLSLVAVLLIGVPAVRIADAQGGDPAVLAAEWLVGQQEDDGSFESDLTATALAVIALNAVGEDTDAALAWMENYVAGLTEDEALGMDTLSAAVVAVAAAGQDVGAFADSKLLELYNTLLIGQRGEDIPSLCVGLLAMPSTGAPFPPTAIGALVGFQNDDGSFGKETDDTVIAPSVTTALCAQVLTAAGETDAVAAALEYLKTIQNEDGGWSTDAAATESDAFATSFVIMALLAADEDLADWNNPERALFALQDPETGAFTLDGEPSVETTALAAQVFRGVTWGNIGAAEEGGEVGATPEAGETGTEEGPALDKEWALVGGPFGIELDTADDFFQTVTDPFTGAELTGATLINWVAEYTHTGYIVEQFLPAEVLLWLADHDPTFWDNISAAALKKLPADVLAQLPEDVQAKAAE